MKKRKNRERPWEPILKNKKKEAIGLVSTVTSLVTGNVERKKEEKA